MFGALILLGIFRISDRNVSLTSGQMNYVEKRRKARDGFEIPISKTSNGKKFNLHIKRLARTKIILGHIEKCMLPNTYSQPKCISE